MDGDYFSTTEVADHLGTSQRAVLHMISRGRLKAVKVGYNWFIRFEDLPDDWPPNRLDGRPGVKMSRSSTPRIMHPVIGECEICGEVKKLVQDHDHKNGHRRGQICYLCNSGLGYFRDSPEIMKRAIQYLKSK